jgi:hypothetical protein
MKVTLRWFEVLLAASVGVRRQLEALRASLPDCHGFDGETSWQVHIEGACGEMAFAKAARLFWSGSVNSFKNGCDMGNIQVRTRSREDYDLIVRENDRDEDAFVLVIGKAPEYRVVGWIRGADAKRPEWRKTYGNRPAASFVPQAALRDMTMLPVGQNQGDRLGADSLGA